MEMLTDIWDKTTDAFSSATEKLSNGLVRLFGSSNERAIRRMRVIVEEINRLEPQYTALDDEGLRAKTDEFRDRLENGETLEDVLPQAFAACREAGRRYLKMRHYDVQLMGGMVLHGGNIAEMVTGEGKTLVATLPAYLNALEGKGVHVVTVNDYLARRDAEWMSPLFTGLGLTVGAIQSQMDNYERKQMYQCDITYGTNNEFGFDYLRDNMKTERGSQVQGPLRYAIVDEVDSILIDEARTPLIISGPAFDDVKKYAEADRVSRGLERGKHFEVKEKERTCHLTEDGVREAERLAGVESFYTPGAMEWPHLIDNSLKAYHLYKRDRDYMVKDGEVIIIDEFTGRLMVGRQWSDGLHQAVEAKERVKIKEENQTLATITLQNYFKLYKKISGMTGTAMTEANEFYKVYTLDVIAMPTNKAMLRINSPDVIFKTEDDKIRAIIEEIREVHASGRPILVGTTSVAKSEELAEMLSRYGIPHQVLNAKYHERESEIVAQAGSLGRVTIATNMAGRGTDIILGGNPDYMAWADLRILKDPDGRPLYPTRLEVPPEVWSLTVGKYEDTMKAEGRKIAALGGLHVIGTERHEARRIDNQLRGRCGRQGDPGTSRFFLALEDDLMRKFIGEFAAKIIGSSIPDGEAIESKLVTRRIEGAQKKIEERNFDIRKNLLEYDEVMDQQRKRVYTFRQRLLEEWPPKYEIFQMINRQILDAVKMYLAPEYGPGGFTAWILASLGVDVPTKDYLKLTYEEAVDLVKEQAEKQMLEQIEENLEEHFPREEERSEWNWLAMANWFSARFNQSIKDRDLKKFLTPNAEIEGGMELDRLGLVEFLCEKARETIEKFDFQPAKQFFEPEYGRLCLNAWVQEKFRITLDDANLQGNDPAAVAQAILQRTENHYEDKEIAFPVQVGLAGFVIDRTSHHSARYDRDGLALWASERFQTPIDPHELHALMKHEIDALLVEKSRVVYQAGRLGRELEPLLNAAFPIIVTNARGPLAGVIEPGKTPAGVNKSALPALHDWAAKELRLETSADELAEMGRWEVWKQFHARIDALHRPEMRQMEKMLLLQMVDNAWMEHLRTMDHLRSSVGLRSYAQVDPKTEYKREGMRHFEDMWTSIADRATSLVFRMENFDLHFLHDLANRQISRAQTVHEDAGSSIASSGTGVDGGRTAENAATNSSESAKREPLRNLAKKVGRNDPCPCGSGKKFKACCMRNQASAN